MPNWNIPAEAKRHAISTAIPSTWHIHTPSSPPLDLTGNYIRSFLTAREIEITETDTAGIAEKTTTGVWGAEEVVAAFCHRAGIAHQFVGTSVSV